MGDYLAYGFDRTIYLYGTAVDNLLEAQEIDNSDPKKPKTVPKYTLDQALEVAANPERSRFSSFASIFSEMEATGSDWVDT